MVYINMTVNGHLVFGYRKIGGRIAVFRIPINGYTGLCYNKVVRIGRLPSKEMGGEDHRKANFDVELAVDVIDLSRNYDTLLLLSGDSDFVALVRYLHRKGKRAFVLSTRGSVAKELVDESDGYLVLNEWTKVVRPYRKNHPAVKRGN